MLVDCANVDRRQTDLDDGLRVWRSFKMGKLLDLIVLDTRNYDRSITSLGMDASTFFSFSIVIIALMRMRD
jgi:phosphodiesterase/alkaline phosphatase D-like protein